MPGSCPHHAERYCTSGIEDCILQAPLGLVTLEEER